MAHYWRMEDNGRLIGGNSRHLISRKLARKMLSSGRFDAAESQWCAMNKRNKCDMSRRVKMYTQITARAANETWPRILLSEYLRHAKAKGAVLTFGFGIIMREYICMYRYISVSYRRVAKLQLHEVELTSVMVANNSSNSRRRVRRKRSSIRRRRRRRRTEVVTACAHNHTIFARIDMCI